MGLIPVHYWITQWGHSIKPTKGDWKMGLFGKKKEAKEQKPIEEVMAQNVFGKTLLPGEKTEW